MIYSDINPENITRHILKLKLMISVRILKHCHYLPLICMLSSVTLKMADTDAEYYFIRIRNHLFSAA